MLTLFKKNTLQNIYTAIIFTLHKKLHCKNIYMHCKMLALHRILHYKISTLQRTLMQNIYTAESTHCIMITLHKKCTTKHLHA